jgi:secreted trypsin-like serine protease
MKYLSLVIILTSITGFFTDSFIITRHDKADEEYIKFAQELPVTSAIIKYNTTDVAGTLITPDWILSAAHVAEHIKKDQKLILNKDSLIVEKVVIHPGWLENGRPEDIALVKLKTPVSDQTPVKLYRNRNETGKEVIVVGNGDYGTGLSGPAGNDGKFRAGTNLIDDATNEYLIWGFEDPRENPEKVTRLEGISGPGDSSGPAFIQIGNIYYLAGISSGQSTSATDGKEGLYGVTEYYTRVSSYLDWIEKTISE